MLEATALPNETESLPIDLNTVYHRDQTLEKIDCCTLGKAKTKAFFVMIAKFKGQCTTEPSVIKLVVISKHI